MGLADQMAQAGYKPQTSASLADRMAGAGFKAAGAATPSPVETSQISTNIPKKNTLGDAARKLLDFTGGGNIANSIGTLGGFLYTKAKDLIQGTNVADNYDLSAPTPLQTVGDAGQVGLLAAPVGEAAALATKGVKALGAGAKIARPLGEALTSVGTGYAYDVAGNAAQGKTGTDVVKPGGGAIAGTLLPGAAAASWGAQKLLPAAAPRLINSLIKPLAKDFAYGKNPGRTVADLGITGNTLDELATNITKARQQVGQQAGQLGRQLDSTATVYLGNALKPLDDAMHEAASQNNQTVLNRLKEVKDALTKNLVLGKDGTIQSEGTKPWFKTGNANYTEGLTVKQRIGDLTKFTGNPSDDKAVNSALKRTYGTVKEALDKAATAVDSRTAATLRDLNEKYADLTSAEVATKYRDVINQRQNLIGLPASAAGIGAAIVSAIATGGAAIPAILAGASGIAVEKALATPAVKTRIAAALAKIKPSEAEGLFNKLPFLKNFIAPGDKTSLGDYLRLKQ